MKLAALFWTVQGIWAMSFFLSYGTEDASFDKRYIAALAKNDRLPKFMSAQKKSEEFGDLPLVENTNYILQDVSDLNNAYNDALDDGSSIYRLSEDPSLESSPYSTFEDSSNSLMKKRNVAALARLGRLNTIRYGRFQPHYVSGKRVSSERYDDPVMNIYENVLDRNDVECEPYEDDANETNEIAEEISGKQKKRYVAALARSGRLPIWHSQRMWSGRKRDDTYPSYTGTSRMDIENNLDNLISDVPYFTEKQRRCRNVYEYRRQKRSLLQSEDSESTSDEYGREPESNYQQTKRNLAALARNGKLPFRRFQDGKRMEEEIEQPEDFLDEKQEDKRNIASLARDSKLLGGRSSEGKRNIAALARNGKLSSFSINGKRNIASLAKNGKLFMKSYGKKNEVSLEPDESIDDIEEKRNIAALARNGKLRFNGFSNDKRNVAALARNGKLPTFFENEGKRNLAALARNGKLPSFYYVNGKRNIQALARNGKLPAFTDDKRDSEVIDDKRDSDSLDDKRNVAALARNNKLPSFTYEDKRNVAALARNGKLPYFTSVDDKRNIAALARNGKLRAYNSIEDKRNVAALARNGKLKMFNYAPDKRNVAALARNGKLPMFNSGDEKRNMAALARNGKLPSFHYAEGKRNIAALARNGKLPDYNNLEDKRDNLHSEVYDQEDKRNVAALARKGQLMSLNFPDGKRNIASLARNGKLLRNDKRSNTISDAPLGSWDAMVFQEDVQI